MKLKPKNWADFQHYRDRSPPWIKLHKSLLDDSKFQRLPVASRALAPMLWLLASECKDGVFNAEVSELAFRLRQTDKEIRDALTPLISKGFFISEHDASDVLAEGKRDAIPEREAETERETEADSARSGLQAKRKCRLPEDFTPNPEWTQANLMQSRIAEELQRFRDYHTAKGTTMLDWQAAWRTWVGNAKRFAKPNGFQSIDYGPGGKL